MVQAYNMVHILNQVSDKAIKTKIEQNLTRYISA